MWIWSPDLAGELLPGVGWGGELVFFSSMASGRLTTCLRHIQTAQIGLDGKTGGKYDQNIIMKFSSD